MNINYGFEKINISQLDEISITGNNHYNYKKLNFLVRSRKENDNIIFYFHGAIANYQLNQFPFIFRGYNHNIPNTDIISVSDFLLDKYKNYTVNWTLETEKYNSDKIYYEVFSYLINSKNYKKVVFTGTSAGGFPAVKFACIFKEYALISNSQLYIENYNINEAIDYINSIMKDTDKIKYETKMIEHLILKSNPKKIIYYQNEKDTIFPPHSAYNDFLQFKKFITENNLNHIVEFNPFTYDVIPENMTQHSFQFPINNNYQEVLINFILGKK